MLSVVAQQILSILSSLAANSERFVFEGREIDLIWSCGIFITMNPGVIAVSFIILFLNKIRLYDCNKDMLDLSAIGSNFFRQ